MGKIQKEDRRRKQKREGMKRQEGQKTKIEGDKMWRKIPNKFKRNTILNGFCFLTELNPYTTISYGKSRGCVPFNPSFKCCSYRYEPPQTPQCL